MTFIEVAHLGFEEIMQTAMVYKAATRRRLGNDASALFWTDWWLSKVRLEDIVPNLFACVTKKAIRKRIVCEGLDGRWCTDVTPNMYERRSTNSFGWWIGLTEVHLLQGVEDTLVWAWENDTHFSALFAYRAPFAGRVENTDMVQIWRSQALAT